MKTETLIAVKDVEKSSKWYQDFLGCRSGHGGPHFDMLYSGDNLLLMLHKQNSSEGGSNGDLGKGVEIFFVTENVETLFKRAKELSLKIIEELQFNKNANHDVFTVNDPDGF